jgi:hypothetical protein
MRVLEKEKKKRKENVGGISRRVFCPGKRVSTTHFSPAFTVYKKETTHRIKSSISYTRKEKKEKKKRTGPPLEFIKSSAGFLSLLLFYTQSPLKKKKKKRCII